MIKAIPTTYSNARFRSRLEAKWAAFFDLCGWRWEYEPLDLDGWVPDFGIVGHKGLILCEVKPIEWTPSVDPIAVVAGRADLKKIMNVDREVLILGAYPINFEFYSWEFAGIGIMARCPKWRPLDRNLASLHRNDVDGYEIGSLVPFDGGPWKWISYLQDADLENNRALEIGVIKSVWNEASSLVQWNAKD